MDKKNYKWAITWKNFVINSNQGLKNEIENLCFIFCVGCLILY